MQAIRRKLILASTLDELDHSAKKRLIGDQRGISAYRKSFLHNASCSSDPIFPRIKGHRQLNSMSTDNTTLSCTGTLNTVHPKVICRLCLLSIADACFHSYIESRSRCAICVPNTARSTQVSPSKPCLPLEYASLDHGTASHSSQQHILRWLSKGASSSKSNTDDNIRRATST